MDSTSAGLNMLRSNSHNRKRKEPSLHSSEAASPESKKRKFHHQLPSTDSPSSLLSDTLLDPQSNPLSDTLLDLQSHPTSEPLPKHLSEHTSSPESRRQKFDLELASIHSRSNPLSATLVEPPSDIHADHSSNHSSANSSLPELRREKYNHQSTLTNAPLDPPLDPSSATLSFHSPKYWDTLSKIWLTKDALRELDRRNDLSDTDSFDLYQEVEISSTQEVLIDQKDLKRFARQGGPNNTDLVGYPEPVITVAMDSQLSGPSGSGSNDHDEPMGPPKPTTDYQKTGFNAPKSIFRVSKRGKTATTPRDTPTVTTTTKASKKSTAHNANFQQKLVDNGIYIVGHKLPSGGLPPKPTNWNDIINRLTQPSNSLSTFSEDEFNDFVQADNDAEDEEAVKREVIPKLLTIGGRDGAQKSIKFTNLLPLDNLEDDGFAVAQPNYYFGTGNLRLDAKARIALDRNICPSKTAPDLPIIPNFFLETAGPHGSQKVVMRRLCHDGAYGIRAMQSTIEYAHGRQVFDDKAYTFSALYHSGTLRIFSHHATAPDGPNNPPKYYMQQVRGFIMNDNKDAHVQGLTALRNVITLAKEMRDTVIEKANIAAVFSSGRAKNVASNPTLTTPKETGA